MAQNIAAVHRGTLAPGGRVINTLHTNNCTFMVLPGVCSGLKIQLQFPHSDEMRG